MDLFCSRNDDFIGIFWVSMVRNRKKIWYATIKNDSMFKACATDAIFYYFCHVNQAL